MNDKRCERADRTFYDRFLPFHKVEDIHPASLAAAGVMLDLVGEPVAAGFDKLGSDAGRCVPPASRGRRGRKRQG